MANDNDTTRRPRPFAPPAPPFPGAGAPPRAPSGPAASEGVKRPPPFVATRPAAAPAITQASPVPAPVAAPPSAEPPLPVPVATAPIAVGDDPAPEEAAQALSGLPYIDNTGAAHEPDERVPASRLSGKMHRVEHDVPAILDGIATKIRSGELSVPNVDPFAGDAAVLAAVLAAMLRHREG